MLKALGAVQAVSDRGRDQKISKQEGIQGLLWNQKWKGARSQSHRAEPRASAPNPSAMTRSLSCWPSSSLGLGYRLDAE